MQQNSAEYFERLTTLVKQLNTNEFEAGLTLVRKAWREGRQIITLGNGGSAMTALHFATDWAKMVYLSTGIQMRARSLLDNIGLVTAYSNDIAYADVFSEQLKAVAIPGDLVIAISGSGNSENIVRAVICANAMGCETLGLSGFSGGRLKATAKTNIWVASNDMQLCEDIHSMFGHIVMQALCRK